MGRVIPPTDKNFYFPQLKPLFQPYKLLLCRNNFFQFLRTIPLLDVHIVMSFSLSAIVALQGTLPVWFLFSFFLELLHSLKPIGSLYLFVCIFWAKRFLLLLLLPSTFRHISLMDQYQSDYGF